MSNVLKPLTFDSHSRRRLRRKVQNPTAAESGLTPDAHGDADEARAVPTDVAVQREGEPDAFAQMPAAAPAMTDEEAGLDDRPPEGGIRPLLNVRKPHGGSGPPDSGRDDSAT
jgi:hypothetical protein